MRVYRVKKARKDQGTCSDCGKPIKAGQAYKYIEFRYGGARKRHAECRDFRPSEMTQSKMSGIYAAQESFSDSVPGFASAADVAAALNDAAGEIRSVGEEYGESAQNMEDGFGHETYQSGELREKADSIEQWADEIESVATEVESADEVCTECGEGEDDHHEFLAMVDHPDQCAGADGCDKPEEQHHDFETDLEGVIEQADSILNEVPV